MKQTTSKKRLNKLDLAKAKSWFQDKTDITPWSDVCVV